MSKTTTFSDLLANYRTQDNKILEEINQPTTRFKEQTEALQQRRFDLLSRVLNQMLGMLAEKEKEQDDMK